jgi:hypothetical protein
MLDQSVSVLPAPAFARLTRSQPEYGEGLLSTNDRERLVSSGAGSLDPLAGGVPSLALAQWGDEATSLLSSRHSVNASDGNSSGMGVGRETVPPHLRDSPPPSSLRTVSAASCLMCCRRRKPAVGLGFLAAAFAVWVWRMIWIFGVDGTVITLPDGSQLRGSLTGLSTREFRGLPYAAPPVGRLRWLPPRAPEPWSSGTIRDAQQHQANCAQTDLLGYGWSWPSMAGGRASSEDCLYLTVYAPRVSRLRGLTGTAQVPVLVYLHGGANFNGGSNDRQLDGAFIADALNVVVVVPN